MDAAVKVDESLLKKVEEFVKKNKYQFSSKKQVVNLAVIEFLKMHSLNNKKRGKKNG